MPSEDNFFKVGDTATHSSTTTPDFTKGLNPAQAEAVNTLSGPLLILAGAGSGKTKVLVDRLSGRRVCLKCGATYHVVFNPSPKGENCGVCGEALTIRADDDPAVVRSRLDVYHEQTEPLKDFYAKKGLLKIVEGQEKLEDTTALTFKALENA